MSRSVSRLVEELTAAGYAVVLVSTSPVERPLDWVHGLPSGLTVHRRANLGYDFGSWAVGLDRYPVISGKERVLLVNDSMLGPFASLEPVLTGFESSSADVWGLTESAQRGRHLQSYFIGFRDGVLQSEPLRRFWREVRDERDKNAVILRGELGLGRLVARAGLSVDAMFGAGSVSRSGRNPTVAGWRGLLDGGVPMVKRQLVTHPQVGPDAVDVPAEVRRRYGADVRDWL